jgi:hypothetical protein
VSHLGDPRAPIRVIGDFVRTVHDGRPVTLPLGPTYLGIRCLVCGFVSWNLHDVALRYCGTCHRFHEG